MLRHLWNGMRNLLGMRALERDLDAEVRSWEETLIAEKMAAGVSAAEARRQARTESGSAGATMDAVRDRRAGASIERLARDVRYAVRTLSRSPAFTTFTVLTFALAIGGMSVIFTLVNAIFLKPLPYPDADRLVMTMEADAQNEGDRNFANAAPNWQDWEKQNTVFSYMALYEYLGFNVSGDGEPEQVGGLRTSNGLFGVLGIKPLLGRGLQPADDAGTNGKVVVLAYRLWQRRFHADSGIVGRTIRLNGEPWQVVGVMPEAFAFPSRGQQVFVPIQLNATDASRGSHSFLAVARLKDGVSVAEANTAMHAIGDRLALEYPASNRGETATAYPMKELWVEGSSEILRALMIAVGLVLLIASANVAGLMVARGSARRREIAARLALGGTRGRVVRELVTEGVLLSLTGAALGLALAVFGLRELVGILPQTLRSVPFRSINTVSLDPTIFAFAAAVALLAGIAAGLPAALAVMPHDLASALRDGSARGATERGGHRFRGALVSLEVALAIVVLVGAGLLVASINRLHQVAPGIDPHNVMALRVELPQSGDFYGPAVRTSFCADVAREVGALPGIVSASAVSHVPFSGANAGRDFVIDGESDPGDNTPGGWYGTACPGYFRTMGISLIAGRDFTLDDKAGAPPAVVVNETLVQRYFAGRTAVGRRIKLGGFASDAPWMTIVGVVADVHHAGLQSDLHPYLYATYQQGAWPGMSVVVRTAGPPPAQSRAVKDALHRAEPEQPVSDAVTMDAVLDTSLGHQRFPMILFELFGAMAALLAALGVFGVATQSVLQRRRELGIRMALGARSAQVFGLVLRQVMTPVGFGVLGGIVGALAGTRVLSGLLFGIKANDPATIAFGALALGLVALAACLIPARRATRVDPAIVLRQD